MKEQSDPPVVPCWRRSAILIALLSLAVLCWSAPRNSAHPAPRDAESQIRMMIERYTESVSRADTDLASQIWLNSPDVSFIHPLGHEHGFEQVKEHVYRQLMGETFSERKLTAHDISIHVNGNNAWAEFYWDFTAKTRKDGSLVTSRGRETQIYTRAKGEWRLVHVHYSGMPVAPSGS